MRIVQYLHNSKVKHFCRTLLQSNNINYYIVIDISYKHNLENGNYNNIYYYKNDKESYNIINKIDPEIVILTISPKNTLINQLRKNISCKKIVYIHHGVLHDRSNIEYIKKTWDKNIQYMVCDLFTEMLLKNNVTENVIKLDGLPQFDRILLNNISSRDDILQKYKLSKNIRLICIIVGNYITNDQIDSILMAIFDNLKNIHIFIKYKTDVARKNFIKRNSNITFINSNSLIYDYLKCDINIILNSCTTLLESLLIENYTIYYNTGHKDNNYILSVYSIDELISCLEKINKNIIDNNYEKEKNNFIDKYIGNKIQLISDEILNTLTKEHH